MTTQLNHADHPAGTRAIMYEFPHFSRQEIAVREWSPAGKWVRLAWPNNAESWYKVDDWRVEEVLPSRAPLSCGSAPVADTTSSAKSAHAILLERAEHAHGRYRTMNENELNTTLANYRLGKFEAFAEAAELVKDCAAPPPARPFPTEEECRAEYWRAYSAEPVPVEDINAGLRAVRSLCLAAHTAPSIGDRARDELWCHALTKTLDARQIQAVTQEFNRLRDLAALPAQTTSGTESEPRKRWICGRCLENERRVRDANLQPKPLEHCDDCALRDVPFPVSLTLPGEPCRFSIDRDMLPAAAPEPERETDVHTLTGNCRASAAVWIGDACNGGEYCDRCHEHDSPRGKCATCDRCACCDALFVKIMRVEDVDAAIAKRDRDLGAASPLPQSPQGGKPTNAN